MLWARHSFISRLSTTTSGFCIWISGVLDVFLVLVDSNQNKRFLPVFIFHKIIPDANAAFLSQNGIDGCLTKRNGTRFNIAYFFVIGFD